MARQGAAVLARRAPRRLIRWVGRHQGLPLLGRLGAYTRAAVSIDGVVPHGEAAGLRFNAKGGNAGFALGTSEPEIQRAFAELLASGQVVYDAGAASGFYTVIAARRVGARGRIISFEPRPDNAERVRHNAVINDFANVDVLSLALSDHDGSDSFSLGADANRGGLTDVHAEPGSGGTIEVQTATIDALVAKGAIPPPSVIKMDIEGAEVEALVGAERTLIEHGPALLIEVHGRGAELEALLQRLGYAASVLEADVPMSALEWGMHVLAQPN